DPGLVVELREYVTRGDRVQDVPLSQVGGKGLFTKEIEEALLSGEADVAVHSLKDLPSEMPPGLVLAAIPEREDPRDALVPATAGWGWGSGSPPRSRSISARRRRDRGPWASSAARKTLPCARSSPTWTIRRPTPASAPSAPSWRPSGAAAPSPSAPSPNCTVT